jgi:hypothetical protein
MKPNIFEKIVFEQLYLTANLKLAPIQITEDFVVLNGQVSCENRNNETKNILIYLDCEFYDKISRVINENIDKNQIQFSKTIVENFFRVDHKWYCSDGNVISKNKVLF